MKRFLSIVVFAFCTLLANAQFQNPFIYNDGEYVNLSFDVRYQAIGGDGIQFLPQDTIVGKGLIGTGFFIQYRLKEAPEEAVEFVRNLKFRSQLLDHYGNMCKDSHMVPYTPWESEDFFETLSTMGMADQIMTYQPALGGHYYWSWSTVDGSLGQSGHVQMNTDPMCDVWGANEGFKPVAHMPLDIKAEIRTGFPYDVAKYQGSTKYTVLDPDSNMVCQKEIALTMSADSIMLEQIQRNLLCTIDSAMCGNYKVIVEAPYLDAPKVCIITVDDPLENASSRKPVNATYRLRESNFKSKGKGNGWAYSGPMTPSYHEGDGVVVNSAMVVRSEKNKKGNGFSLTQSIDKMPMGFYTLAQPVIYKPCDFSEMEGNTEILVDLEANGCTAKATNIMVGVQETVVEEGGEEYVTVRIPSNDAALARSMSAYQTPYTATVVFEVMEDSTLTIGVHKTASALTGEITAIGEPVLTYYGKGLPYGKVTMPSDSVSHDNIYAAGQDIELNVKLVDGIGMEVPSVNYIELAVVPLTKDGPDFEKPVAANSVSAGKAGDYDVAVTLPEASKVQPGDYVLLVASLYYNEEYELHELIPIKITGSTAVEALTMAPSGIQENVYTISGVKIASPDNAKGVYIKGGRKEIK